MKVFVVHRAFDNESLIEGIFSTKDKALAHLFELLGVDPPPNHSVSMDDLEHFIEECEIDAPIERS